jgi:ribonuclease HII
MSFQTPTLCFEAALWQSGLERIAGVDEAGRGCWAGPVFAAAVMLPPASTQPLIDALAQRLAGVRDSKQMTALQRERWAEKIKEAGLGWGIGAASNREIDELGILPATRLAMQRALAQLEGGAQHLLIDAVRLPACPLPQTPLVKGDARCLSIAAASVLAKTARDAFMAHTADAAYPAYGFARHKGYGTALHQAQLRALGACPLHRFSFAPLKKLLPAKD